LRIAQIAPVAAPVRPGAGDSVEHLVSLLSEELVRRGHEVTLYATGDSETSARLRSVYARGYDEDPDEPWEWRYREIVHAAHAWEHAGEHDLLHLHDFHWGLPFAGLSPTPVVETPHTELPPEVLEEYGRQEHVHVAAVSAHQARALAGITGVSVVPHGIDVSAFPAGSAPGDYLLFLGRMLPDKGPAEAIGIARAAGLPLVLAGPASAEYDPAADPEVDGEQVRWVGRVDAEARNRLLAGAAALVFPLRYPEPFGLVVIEAMACGTPVLATALGAVPELVEDGVTGFTAPTPADLAELVAPARTLDRAVIRRVAEERWDFRRMVDDYEALYARLAG
jgi:glycosyltransferase involved in cell wall biosynthesis